MKGSCRRGCYSRMAVVRRRASYSQAQTGALTARRSCSRLKDGASRRRGRCGPGPGRPRHPRGRADRARRRRKSSARSPIARRRCGSCHIWSTAPCSTQRPTEAGRRSSTTWTTAGSRPGPLRLPRRIRGYSAHPLHQLRGDFQENHGVWEFQPLEDGKPRSSPTRHASRRPLRAPLDDALDAQTGPARAHAGPARPMPRPPPVRLRRAASAPTGPSSPLSCWICAQGGPAARCRASQSRNVFSDSRMSTQRFASFHDFYPFYLREHSSRDVATAARRGHFARDRACWLLPLVTQDLELCCGPCRSRATRLPGSGTSSSRRIGRRRSGIRSIACAATSRCCATCSPAAFAGSDRMARLKASIASSSGASPPSSTAASRRFCRAARRA